MPSHKLNLDAIEARANADRLPLRHQSRMVLACYEDRRLLVSALRRAMALLKECHDQYGMPIGTNERIAEILRDLGGAE